MEFIFQRNKSSGPQGLPIEIWDTILLKYLQNPLDLLSCSRTCLQWEKIISKAGKTQFLFSQVLPAFGEYLSPRDLLKCRLVSHTWRDAVDTTQFPYYDGTTLERVTPFHTVLALGTRFNAGSDIKKFLQDMKHHPGNPFPNRALLFSPTQDVIENGELEEFYERFHELLSRFGKYIWRFTFEAFPRINFQQQIGWIFQLLPNMKYLNLLLSFLGKDEMEDLCVSLESHDWSEMKNFTHLRIFGGRSYLLAKILMENYGHQLVSFSSWISDRWLLVRDFMEDDVLPKWVPIVENLYQISELSMKPINLRTLELFVKLDRWNLRKLSLEVRCSDLDSRYGCLDLLLWNSLQVFNKFSDSLEELCIEWTPFTCIYPFTHSGCLERICLCNRSLGKLGLDMEETIQLPLLKKLSIPHGILHPNIFKPLIRKCVTLQELQINDLHNQNAKGYVPPNMKKLSKVVVQLWEEVPRFVERITVLEVFYPRSKFTFYKPRNEFAVYSKFGGKRKNKFKSKLLSIFQSKS